MYTNEVTKSKIDTPDLNVTISFAGLVPLETRYDMIKAFAQDKNVLYYELRMFNMIKHRNYKVKVFTITDVPICYSLGGTNH